MTTFVIVHGAWGGGWEWSTVARLLRERRHEVFTPTLTGLGERAHLADGEPVGLSTYVDDVVAVLEFEDLRDVVLCGTSYGGMPATGAADRVADRIRLLVCVDALVPRDGQSALDLLPVPFGDAVRAGVAAQSTAWRVPVPDDLLAALMPEGSLPDDQRDAYLARVRYQPAATFTEPVRLTGAVDRLPRAFVRCLGGHLTDELGGDPIEAGAGRAREEGWRYEELSAPHDPQVYDPVGVATVLERLASTAP